jgi:hypothetical protein
MTRSLARTASDLIRTRSPALLIDDVKIWSDCRRGFDDVGPRKSIPCAKIAEALQIEELTSPSVADIDCNVATQLRSVHPTAMLNIVAPFTELRCPR